jgi:mRNA-degrading endonuclease RelE of RelBE toxin-antitoxin system
MIINYGKDFDKSIKRIKDKIAIKRLLVLVEKLENAKSLKEISNVIQMANNPFLYRIRTGDYRLLVEYIDGNITILLIEYLKRDDNTYRKYN